MNDEHLTIQLSEECVESLSTDRDQFAKLLHEELSEHIDEIESYLPRYCTEMREDFTDGSTEILDCDIEVDDTGKGSLYINFYGYVHMGCKDMCHEVDHSEQVMFRVDSIQRTITLHFPHPPQRDPDEI